MITKNGAGRFVWSRYWIAVIFGGDYLDRKLSCSGWRPNIIRAIRKYYREQWHRSGYSLWEFIK